jgi:hypothetical protein
LRLSQFAEATVDMAKCHGPHETVAQAEWPAGALNDYTQKFVEGLEINRSSLVASWR